MDDGAPKPRRRTRDFWAKVAKAGPDDCWPWQGYIGPSGHGKTSYKSMNILASRKAWILTHGEPLQGLCVNHRCDNALCCNPAHMYLGTRADNMADMWRETPGHERGHQKRLGTVLNAEELTRLYQMRRNGVSLKDCAAIFNMHMSSVCRIVNAYRRKRIEELRQRVSNNPNDVQS